MKRICFCIFLFSCVVHLRAQNLVPNPSFEEYTECPDAEGQIDRAIGWQTCRGSSDYLNMCGVHHLFGVPSNIMGYQQPATGNAYAHVICYSPNTQDTIALREWIGISLAQPLQIGTRYYASVKISWTTNEDTIIGSIRYANNKFGINLSTQPYLTFDFQSVPNQAHIYSEEIVADSVGWTLISGSFVADSAYTFVSVGNFFGDLSTTAIVLNPGGSNYLSDYYVDDVCVSDDFEQCSIVAGFDEGASTLDVKIPTVFSDRIELQGFYSKAGSVQLFSLDGKQIPLRTEWMASGAILHVGAIADGPYVISYSTDRSHYERTILLHLNPQ